MVALPGSYLPNSFSSFVANNGNPWAFLVEYLYQFNYFVFFSAPSYVFHQNSLAYNSVYNSYILFLCFAS